MRIALTVLRGAQILAFCKPAQPPAGSCIVHAGHATRGGSCQNKDKSINDAKSCGLTRQSWLNFKGDLPSLVDAGGAPVTERSRAATCGAGSYQTPPQHMRATAPGLGGGEAHEGRPDPEGGASAPTGRARGGNQPKNLHSDSHVRASTIGASAV